MDRKLALPLWPDKACVKDVRASYVEEESYVTSETPLLKIADFRAKKVLELLS